MVYNLMTCEGFQVFASSAIDIAKPFDCNMAWTISIFVVFAVLFLVFILRKQCSDGFLSGNSYNVWGALAVGLGACIILITLTGEARWGLLAGLGGIALGGFGLGKIFDTSEGDGDSGGSE